MNARIAAVLVALFLAGCASRTPAPVTDRTAEAPPPAPAVETPPAPEPPPVVDKPVPTHTVKRGETLAGIANQHGVDRRELAAWNSIVNPNALRVGQVLVLGPPGSGATVAAPSAPVITPLVTGGPPIEARPLGNTATAKVEPRGQKVPFSERALAQMTAAEAGAPPATPVPAQPADLVPAPMPAPAPEPAKPSGTDSEEVDWMWPVKGKVLAPFNETTKGMDIGGRKGAPVLAAAGGRVIYADQGLRGYGKLVIIRHNATWLSAYAHNDNLLVKEQQEVRKGQKIAEMGSTDADQVKLHFEVRRQGKPVDPAKYLPPM
jgi:lipoprotein NlpD